MGKGIKKTFSNTRKIIMKKSITLFLVLVLNLILDTTNGLKQISPPNIKQQPHNHFEPITIQLHSNPLNLGQLPIKRLRTIILPFTQMPFNDFVITLYQGSDTSRYKIDLFRRGFRILECSYYGIRFTL